ncbi:MAG: SAM-dependent methyltransferase, partial [Ilumatobacteraceae bacterium]
REDLERLDLRERRHEPVVVGRRIREHDAVDWHQLATAVDTVVVLMGVAQRAEIAAELMAGSLPADTPVAAIHRATTGAQDVQRFTLGTLAGAEVRSPATIVIGAVAALDVTALTAAVADITH